MSNNKLFPSFILFMWDYEVLSAFISLHVLTIDTLYLRRHLVVRHYEVYFHVRKDLIPHMVNSMQRLGFNSSVSDLTIDFTFQ